MTQEQLSKLNWVFDSQINHPKERIQILVERQYGFRNIVHAEIKEDGKTGRIWGEYEANGVTYDSFEKFAEAITGTN